MKKKIILQFSVHITLIALGCAILMPLFVAFIASTKTAEELVVNPISLELGSNLLNNYRTVLLDGLSVMGNVPITKLLFNSLILALFVAFGKVLISIISAYAIVFFRFPYRKLFFSVILLTLMLPIEIRIFATYEVVASLNMMGSFGGMALPLIASATATFLFRQFFLTIPQHIIEAARIDGVGAVRFFWNFLLPLSKTNIFALFIIMFIYGWNQYLWPLIVMTNDDYETILLGMQRLMSIADQIPQWNYIMTIAIIAMVPPVLVVICLQRLFEKGLTNK